LNVIRQQGSDVGLNQKALRSVIGTAIGLTALGAVAIGVLAIRRLAVRSVVVGRAQIKSLDIEELTVGRIHAAAVRVSDSLELPKDRSSRPTV
jgi:hypothetical protein